MIKYQRTHDHDLCGSILMARIVAILPLILSPFHLDLGNREKIIAYESTSVIQHESHEIAYIPEIILSSWFDTGISFPSLESYASAMSGRTGS